MSDTALVWARRSFSELKTSLSDIAHQQSDNEIVIDRDPGGVYLTRVRFDADPTKPGLDIIRHAKDNLAPDLASGEPMEVEDPRHKHFDVVPLGSGFGWLEPDNLDPAHDTREIEEIIRNLL